MKFQKLRRIKDSDQKRRKDIIRYPKDSIGETQEIGRVLRLAQDKY